MARKNRLADAFKENFNVVGLASAAGLSLAFLNPLPLLIGVVAEVGYLLFVPDSRWYQKRLSERFDAEVTARRVKLREQVFLVISENVQERFTRLEDIRTQLDGHALSEESWMREICRKLDYLLEKFLLFARREVEFAQYLENVYAEVVVGLKGKRREKDGPPVPNEDRSRRMVETIQERFSDEIAQLEGKHEEDSNTQAVLDKRREVLTQRHEYVGRIGRILTNLGHQMQLLEDSFGLINDQIRARPPEQVLADIEGVVTQTDAMTNLLDEIAVYDDMSRRFDL
ncbi:hypothetical protein [Armatimonas sp.]|uniref:hypothetical protein n=1 Tax=Armatimonas sp. TaxID=1872638 RepID=UPI00375399B7